MAVSASQSSENNQVKLGRQVANTNLITPPDHSERQLSAACSHKPKPGQSSREACKVSAVLISLPPNHSSPLAPPPALPCAAPTSSGPGVGKKREGMGGDREEATQRRRTEVE